MPDSIDYFFTTISPFTYLGHQGLMDIARKHGKQVNLRPVALGTVWENSGSVPLGQRSPARQRYRLVELQRFAEYRGVKLNPKPAFFPASPERADLSCVAITLSGADASGFVLRVCQSVWADERDIADEGVLADLLEAEGHDAEAVLKASKGPDAIAARDRNNEAAIAADAIGAPTYVYKGETFWGQDRLELLDAMIASGRDAFKPL